MSTTITKQNSQLKTDSVPDIPSVEPWDEHNQKWVSRVHPVDWKNPTPDGKYNLLVIGAGPAGLVTAIGAAGLGAKVAIVEKHLMGGDCLNVGCVPSKALIRAGKAIAGVRDAHQFGVELQAIPKVDFAAVMQRLRKTRADLSHHDSAARLASLGIDVYIGSGQFAGPKSFAIGGKTIEFSKACIATGARASAPPIRGLQDVEFLTNENIFTLTELPRRIAFIGAGPIGCELSQAFRRFGSEVTLVESSRGLLPKEDREAAEMIRRSLLRDGVKIHGGSRDIQVRNSDDGIHLSVKTESVSWEATVDKLVVAVGRAPNVELGLEAAGVEFSKKGIRVNDRLQTTNKHVFAAGDVASKYQFTHAADFMARIVIGNALFFGRSKASQLTIPWCTYTEPELAHVGRSARELADEGTRFDTFTVPMNEVDRAVLDGDDDGFVRVHADPQGRVLGATIVAAHAGDMIAELSLAITNRVRLGSIAKTIHPYPTQAEAVRKIGDLYNRTRLTPLVKRLMEKFLAWRR